ncbi:MAG: DinB family protein [Saprospiraceae bacterium]|nr:DinB family protein [Saprospiraceae bacterium]
MKRSKINPLPNYFDRYILQFDSETTILEAIQKSIDDLDTLPFDEWEALGSRVYAPNKWTIKDILQHITDTERIFSYRAMCFARGETQSLPSFSEDDYALSTSSAANSRSFEDLIDELKIVHQSTKALFASFTPEMLQKTGVGFKGEYSVASIGFTLPGHQIWHFRVIEERYMPLLKMA